MGILFAFALGPTKIRWGTNPYHFLFRVRHVFDIGYIKGWRGIAIGHTVILNPRVEERDLEHELIHVGQYERFPIIFPFLYYYEMLRHGYQNNKYEKEAYLRAGNVYRVRRTKD